MSSLEENLTNSIRRAKQKVYGLSYGPSLPPAEASTRPPHKHQDLALVSALKTLQEKIVLLESEKAEFLKSRGNQQANKHTSEQQSMSHSPRFNESEEVTKLQRSLAQMEAEVANFQADNKQLTHKNNELVRANQELEAKVECLQIQIDNVQLGKQQNKQQRLVITEQQFQGFRQDKNNKREESPQELQKRLRLAHETIEKTMRELEESRKALAEEKRTNLRWLKLYEEQALNTPSKENRSFEANTHQKHEKKSPQKVSQVLQVNRELGEQLGRSRRRAALLGKELQQSEERFAKLRLLVQEIAQTISKGAAPVSSHLRFLLGRVDKLDHPHLQSLRSISAHSRRNAFKRSGSKEHKKSLKMEDLNSSAKKSQERSSSKKSQNRSSSKKLEGRARVHSMNEKGETEKELEAIEKELAVLKRKHRDLIVRPKDEREDRQRVDEILQAMEQKQTRAEQLRARLQ